MSAAVRTRRLALVALMPAALTLGACGLFGGASESDAPPPSPTGTPGEPTPVVPVPANGPPAGPSEAGGGGTAIGPGVQPATPCPDQGPRGSAFDVSVAWSNVRSTGGCFFFSGPGALGRDTPLGSTARFEGTASGASLAFGNARFEGTSTPDIRLARTSTHDYAGPWRVTETIEGRWVTPQTAPHLDTPCTESPPRTIEATYRYHEFEGSSRTPGHCTITANVTIRAAR